MERFRRWREQALRMSGKRLDTANYRLGASRSPHKCMAARRWQYADFFCRATRGRGGPRFVGQRKLVTESGVPPKPRARSQQLWPRGFPYVDEKHQQLYFSSDGRHGYGGMDLYRIARGRNWRQWSGRANLGPKVNGRGDQLSLTPHPFRKRSYYLVSQDSLEDDLDVYRMRVQKPDRAGASQAAWHRRDRQTGHLVSTVWFTWPTLGPIPD